MNKPVIKCSPLTFFAEIDEKLFFKWIESIKSIKKYEGIGPELHLYFNSNVIPENELLSLMGLFDRYHFDHNELNVFMNKENAHWFQD